MCVCVCVLCVRVCAYCVCVCVCVCLCRMTPREKPLLFLRRVAHPPPPPTHPPTHPHTHPTNTKHTSKAAAPTRTRRPRTRATRLTSTRRTSSPRSTALRSFSSARSSAPTASRARCAPSTASTRKTSTPTAGGEFAAVSVAVSLGAEHATTHRPQKNTTPLTKHPTNKHTHTHTKGSTSCSSTPPTARTPFRALRPATPRRSRPRRPPQARTRADAGWPASARPIAKAQAK